MRSEAGASERVMKNIEVSVIHQAASQLQAAAVDLDELERAASGNVLQEIQKYRTARRTVENGRFVSLRGQRPALRISNFKSQIRNFKSNKRGPLGTRLNEPIPFSRAIWILRSEVGATFPLTAA